jgi:hypothetical protein
MDKLLILFELLIKFLQIQVKLFFNAKEFNEFVKTDEFKAKYPTTEFKIVKETY